MKRVWSCAGNAALLLIGILICLWGTIVLGFWKTEAKRFAEATCGTHPTSSNPYLSCMKSSFRGRSVEDMSRYARGSNFTWWAEKKDGKDELVKYIAIRDIDEKQIQRRIAITFVIRDNLIRDVRIFEGHSVEGVF